MMFAQTVKRIAVIALLCQSALVTAASDTRIVSSGASVTEILYALGQQDKIVATDNTSMYPAAARAKTKLGYFRQLSSEGVLAQHPSHLLGAEATGPKDMLSQVAAAGVKVELFGEQKSIDGLYKMIDELGQITGSQLQARDLVADVKSKVAKSLNRAAKHRERPIGLFVVVSNDRGLTVAGEQTVPDVLFDLLNIDNAAAGLQNYKIIDTDVLLKTNPDFVLVANHMSHGDAVKQLCRLPSLKMTNAGRNCKIKAIDSTISMALSIRIDQALNQISTLAYGD